MFKKLIIFLHRINTLEVAWLLIFAATFSFSRGTMAVELETSLNISNLLRLFFVGGALCLIFPQIINYPPTPRFNPVWLFLFYLFICIVSAIWSVSSIKTIGKAFEVLAPTLIVILCANKKDSEYRLRRLFDWYIIIMVLIVLVHIVGLIVAPDYFSHDIHKISSSWFPSNTISTFSAIIAIICLSRWCQSSYSGFNIGTISKQKYLLCFFIFSIICVYAHGRTAMAIVFITTVLVYIRLKPSVGRVLLVISSAATLVFFKDIVLIYLYRGQTLEELQMLSGRIILIEMSIPFILEKPFIGYGFGVGSDYVFNNVGAGALTGYGENISSVHNGIVEVLLGTGIVGIVLLISSIILAMLGYIKGYIQCKNMDMVMISIYIFAYTFVAGNGLGGWMHPSIALYLVSCTILFQGFSILKKY